MALIGFNPSTMTPIATGNAPAGPGTGNVTNSGGVASTNEVTSSPSAQTYTPNAPETIEVAASEKKAIKPTAIEKEELLFELDRRAEDRLTSLLLQVRYPHNLPFYYEVETISVTVECSSGRKITASVNYRFEANTVSNGKKTRLPMTDTYYQA